MANNRRSFRGKLVDMDEIVKRNDKAIAVGNMNVNSRGDKLDDNGEVIKTHDQAAREYNKSYNSTSTKASIISSFEDEEDEVVEITDDPNVLERQTKGNSKKLESKSSYTKDNDNGPSSEDID